MAVFQNLAILVVVFGIVESYSSYDRNVLDSFTSLRNELRQRRSRSQSIADQIYYQDLLAPFFNRRRHSDSSLLSKRSKGNGIANSAPSDGCKERSEIKYTTPTTATLDVRFPAVHTTKDDTYLCTGYKIPFEDRESFIVKFTPHADMNRTHHMLVYGCEQLDSPQPYWKCWEPCQNKRILYAWARNAPEMALPKDVGYSIGGDSKIRYVAVQMHFANAFNEPSCSGVSADITTEPQKNYAGIFLLGSPNIYLPPHSVDVPSTIACVNQIPEPMHVFAFRTHAHTLANVITGYRFRGENFKMIGKGNPKWPQSFYPRVGGEMVLQQGDILAAQCVYNNTRDVAVRAGPSGSDEMCNLYLMFYTSDKKTLKRELDCWGIPPGYKPSDIKLPPSVLEMPPYPGYAGEDSINAISEGKAVKPPVPDEHMHHHHAGGNGMEGDEEEEAEDPEPDQPESHEIPGYISDEELEEKFKQLKKMLNESEPLSRGHGMPKYQGLQADLSYPQLQDGYTIGAVGGLVADKDGSLYVFHRAGRMWEVSSFDSHNRFTEPDNPIDKDTIYHLDKTTGKVLHAWGKGQFFMPHGASLDPHGYLWLTDVALHQALKYPPEGAKEPIMALGVRMVPGSDVNHFCKPTDVAVDSDGMIYVSDGYCNGRVMKFSSDGTFMKQWGRMVTNRDLTSPTVPPYTFFIAHSIILCGPGDNELCVADRENGRIQCFTKDGDLTRIIEDKDKTGSRIFAITYSPLEGGVIYGVNGPGQTASDTSGGFTIHYDTGAVMTRWQPSPDTPLRDPHDISVSPSGVDVYVGDLTHKTIFKFYDVPSAVPDKGVSGGVAILSQPGSVENIDQSPEDINKKSGPPEGAVETKETDKSPPTEETVKQMSDSEKEVEVKEFPEENINTSAGATVIIVCLVVLPTIALLIAFSCIKIRAKRLKEYESLLSPNGKPKSGKSLNLGKFLKPTHRKGFTRVSSEGSDDEDDGGSDVEVYSKKVEDGEKSTE